jgi:3-methyladenine DNA glycosylase/8-oxoguanine DNA glycosylase
MRVRTLRFEGELDLRASLATLGVRLPGQPSSSAAEGWWIGTAPDGPVTVLFRRRNAAIEVRAWGPGAAWALEHASDLVGLDDDPAAFAPPPGIVAELHRQRRGLRLGKTQRVVDALVPIVLGQKVTTTAAKASYGKMVRRWGRRAPGPIDAWGPPDPAALASLAYEDLHPLGVERKRAALVIEAARRAARLEEIVEMGQAAAYRRLEAVRGIGPWTSAQVMGAAWGDRDAVPVGDFHIPHTVGWALAGEDRAGDARMLELLQPYAGNRRRVILLLKQAGIHAPKYGAKLAVRSFERD